MNGYLATVFNILSISMISICIGVHRACLAGSVISPILAAVVLTVSSGIGGILTGARVYKQ